MSIRDEILEHFAQDQRLGTRYAAALHAGDSEGAEAIFETTLDAVDGHSAWLSELLSGGWPHQDAIGEEAAEALGLHLNHGDGYVHRLALPLVADVLSPRAKHLRGSWRS